MNSTLTKLFVFLTGAAVGAGVTWKILKTKYEKLAQEEIDSVKEVFSKRYAKNEDDVETIASAETSDTTSTEEDTGPSLRDYAVELAKNGYTNYSDITAEEKGNTPLVSEDGPYVISPEEFGSLEDYETISLTYYSDGVLADDLDYRVDNVDELIGIEALSRFGEYEDDSVFVRNDEHKVDYEILMDTRKYADVTRVISPGVTEG